MIKITRQSLDYTPFENENFFESANGIQVTRRNGESSRKFYARILEETGISNDQLTLAGQSFVNGDTLVSILSHFSSLKEADYHFLSSRKDSGLYDVKYQRGKTQGVTSAVSNTILEKMLEVASKSAQKDKGGENTLVYYFKTALEEKEKFFKENSFSERKAIAEKTGVTTTDYAHYLQVYRFLNLLGLTNEASELKINNFLYSTIADHFEYMQGRINKSYRNYREKKGKYQKAKNEFDTLTEEQKKDAFKKVMQVLDNDKRRAKEKKLDKQDREIRSELESSNEITQEEEELTPEEQAKRERREALEALTEDDLNANEKKVYTYYQYKSVPEFDVTKIVKSIANDYAKVLTEGNDSQKPSMIFSKNNNKKYTLHNSSNAWGIIQKIISVKDRLPYLFDKLRFVNSDYYKGNLFVSGKNRMYGWEDFDFSKEISFSGNVNEMSYKDERFKGWINRTLNGQFFDKLNFDTTEGVPVYSQVIPTISNSPTMFAVKMRALNETELVDAISQTIEQMKLRKDIKNTRFDKNSTTLFEVLRPYLIDGKIEGINSKEVAQKIYDVELEQMTLEFAKKIVEAKVPLHKNMINSNFIKLLSPKTKSNLDTLVNSYGGTTRATAYNPATKKQQYLFTPEELVPALKIFVANNYVNSYHLMQLMMGDPAYFKNAEDIIKRSSGAHSPGIRGVVVATERMRKYLGMKPTFNVLVADDIEADIESIQKVLESQRLSEEEVSGLLKLYPKKGFEESDGFGIMVPKRRRDLTRGFGTSYGITHISKPAHYEIMEDGRPVMMKYSSLELTDELVAKYPKLEKLRKNLELMGVDEMVFKSAVKSGAPEKGVNVTDLMTRDLEVVDGQIKFTDDNSEFDMESSKLELSNENYRLQHNPYHNIDGNTANPTQLSYFLNVLSENVDLANRVYGSMAAIFKRRLRNFMDRGFKGMKKDFINSLNGAGNEKMLEYMQAGISFQFPGIEKAAFTKIASMFKRNIIQIKFPNSQKLVAQADVGINKRIWKDEQWITTDEKLKTVVLNKGKENERRISETVIPRGALPAEIEKMVEQRLMEGKEVFAGTGGDFLSFRIPSSEIHSAISSRVVGFFEPQMLDGIKVNSNMIIVPTDLMPIIGHDYDIDSFFTLQRQWAEDENGNRYFPGYTKNRKGEFEFNEKLRTDKLSDREFEAYHMNNIIESFLTGIERPGNNRKRMLAPISFEIIENDIQDIEKLKDENSKPLDLSNPLDNYKAFESSFSGAKGVGIIANAMKSLAYSIRSNEGSYPKFIYKDLFGNKEPRIKFNGKVLDSINERKNETPNLWMLLDAFLNAAIDNVKVQILPRLNIGDNTFKSFIAALAMGVDMKTTNRFMLQPALTALASMQSKWEINSSLDELIARGEELSESEEEEITLDKEELEKWLKYAYKNGIDSIEKILSSDNKDFIVYQAQIARAYKQLNVFGESISTLSNYLSIIKELPVTAKDLKRFMDTRSKIVNDDGSMNDKFRMNMPDFFKVNPHIEELDKVLSQFNNTIRSHFLIHSEKIEEMAEDIIRDMGLSGRDNEKYENIKTEYQKYILSIVEEHPDYKWDSFDYQDIPDITNPKTGKTVSGREALAIHLVGMIDKLGKKLPDNKFLGLISATTGRYGARIQMHGVHTMEYSDIITLRDAFSKLVNYDYDFKKKEIVEYKTDEKYSPLQKHFVRYAMSEYGLQFGTKNFALIFPADIFKNLDKNYCKAIADAQFRRTYLQDFEIQFALANPDAIKAYKPKDGDFEYNGYSPSLQLYYDLKTEDVDSPIVMKTESMINGDIETTLYYKTYSEQGLGSYYQRIGETPWKWYYQAPTGKSAFERFRGDIRNFFVSNIENIPYLTKRPGVEVGSVISVTGYKDKLRNHSKFFEVTSIEDKKMYVAPADKVKDFNPMDVIETNNVKIGNKTVK